MADQATYDLPLNARSGSRIIIVENQDDSPSTGVPPFIVQAFLDHQSGGLMTMVNDFHFMLENGQLRIAPTPSSSSTAALKVYYVPNFGNMVQGSVSEATSTTINAFTSTPNYSQNFGWLDPRDDYYNGMELRITSGPGIGEFKEITDYTGGAAPQFTTAAWTVTPTDASQFAVICPVPEDHHQVVVVNAAMNASIKGRTRFQELRQLYHGHPGQSGILHEMLAWIQKRQDYRMHTVIPSDMGA